MLLPLFRTPNATSGKRLSASGEHQLSRGGRLTVFPSNCSSCRCCQLWVLHVLLPFTERGRERKMFAISQKVCSTITFYLSFVKIFYITCLHIICFLRFLDKISLFLLYIMVFVIVCCSVVVFGALTESLLSSFFCCRFRGYILLHFPKWNICSSL